MHALLEPELWIALITLAALEIVLGIDNIIFLSIMANKLPEHQRARARTIGLAGACLTRIGLLMSLAWLAKLTTPLFHLFDHGVSGRDIILFGGGLFLLGKAALEIHEQVEGDDGHGPDDVIGKVASISFASVIVQIMILDIVFSLDSVITAIGMTDRVPVMVAAIIIAIGVMMFFAGAVSRFVEAHPTIKILALSFLILIGMVLIGEGMGFHVPKAYVYFAMGFSVGVELLNLRMRGKRKKKTVAS
ncbi:MAG TPA: TerC family protein [Solimonas sp.]